MKESNSARLARRKSNIRSGGTWGLEPCEGCSVRLFLMLAVTRKVVAAFAVETRRGRIEEVALTSWTEGSRDTAQLSKEIGSREKHLQVAFLYPEQCRDTGRVE